MSRIKGVSYFTVLKKNLFLFSSTQTIPMPARRTGLRRRGFITTSPSSGLVVILAHVGLWTLHAGGGGAGAHVGNPVMLFFDHVKRSVDFKTIMYIVCVCVCVCVFEIGRANV